MFDFGASHNGPTSRRGQPTRGVCSAAKCVLSEMNKCLSLVHLTRMLQNLLGRSGELEGDKPLFFSGELTTALTGYLQSIGLAPVATGATAAVGPYWPYWPPERFAHLMPSEPDWT